MFGDVDATDALRLTRERHCAGWGVSSHGFRSSERATLPESPVVALQSGGQDLERNRGRGAPFLTVEAAAEILCRKGTDGTTR